MCLDSQSLTLLLWFKISRDIGRIAWDVPILRVCETILLLPAKYLAHDTLSRDVSCISHESCGKLSKIHYFFNFSFKIEDRDVRQGVSRIVAGRRPYCKLEKSHKNSYLLQFCAWFFFHCLNIGLYLNQIRLRKLIWAGSKDRTWNPKSQQNFW